MGKAFASPRRLELLDLLAQAPRTVDELARASEQSTANTSQHLQALHAAGMVTRAREGTSVRYALAGDEALSLWLALRDASIAQLAEVERAARDYLGEDVEAIGRDELIARLRARRRRARRRPPAGGVRGRPHRRRTLDPDRRARAPPGRPAGRPRDRRLLPRPVLRLRARGRPPPAGGRPPGAAPRGRLAGMAAHGQVEHDAAEPRNDQEDDDESHRLPVWGSAVVSARTSRSTSTFSARRSARPTPTSRPIRTRTSSSPPAARGPRSSATPSRSSRAIPDATVESFAGVANHWLLGRDRARRDRARPRLRRRHRPAHRRADDRARRAASSAST